MSLFGKLWSLLNARERASARRQVGLMLIGMVLEMASIGVVLPAVTAMAAGSSAGSPVTVWLRQLLDGLSRPQMILVGLVALLGLYLFKTVFLLFAAWRQVTFVARIQARIARDLFAVYLAQPWTFHLQRNSATLIRNISEIPSFALACISMLMALTEALVLCGIVALLFWIEPAGAFAVFVITAIAAVILERFTRARLTRWGQLFQHHNAAAYQHMLQGFGGMKELKLRGCERNFVDKFSRHRDVQVLMQARHSLFSMIPRLWFEMLAATALCGLMLVMAWEGRSTQAMIPVLGLFAAAAFRILPAINRLSGGLQSIRYSTATIETLVEELALGRPDDDGHPVPKLRFERELVVEDVSYRYPGTDREALADVSLTIPRGAAIGLVGGSGSGKSTLVDLILGLLTPGEGRITIDGANLQDCVRGWQRMVGYVPQSIYLCDDTIRRNIAFGVPDDQIDEAAVQRAIKAAQLADFVATLPLGVESVVGEQGTSLSGGQRQRIGIARALYHDPEVIVLDEATSSLDPDTERGVMAAVNALHGTKTLLIVANRLITVSNCDTLYRIENGRLVQQGSFAEVVGS